MCDCPYPLRSVTAHVQASRHGRPRADGRYTVIEWSDCILHGIQKDRTEIGAPIGSCGAVRFFRPAHATSFPLGQMIQRKNLLRDLNP